jgi:hypothetical protein
VENLPFDWEQKIAQIRRQFGLWKTACFSVQNAAFCEQVFNAELTQNGPFFASRKHFREKDLRKANLAVFHSVFRCYYDYEIL